MQPATYVNGEPLQPLAYAAAPSAPATSDIDRTPWEWHRYDPTGYLRRWCDREDERVDIETAERNRPLSIEEVRDRFFGGGLTSESPVEIEILGALALLLWGHDPRAVRRRSRDPDAVRARWGSVTDALTFWVMSTSELGIGSVEYDIAQDKKTTVAARRHAARRGRRRPLLFELTAAGQVAVREAPGFLPLEFRRAKQTSNGSTGGTKSLRGVHDRVAVEKALEAAVRDGLGALDLDSLIAVDVGVWRVVGHNELELIKTRVRDEAVTRGLPEEQMRQRLKRARVRVHEALQSRGLVPAREARHKRPSPAPLTPSSWGDA